MRLQKFLARAGVASRRKSEALIAAGRVTVDGTTVTAQGVTIDPEVQTIAVDGEVVGLRPPEWRMLHKPPAYTCTRDDQRGRATVYDLLPAEDRYLFHVGRLDYMSEGLLLLSNDGELANALLHPSGGIERRYEVTLLGPVDARLPERLVAGVTLDDGPANARRSRWRSAPSGRSPVLEIVLAEGRNREIRRMLKALDVKLKRLTRVAFGPVELGDLPPGASRPLRRDEREALARAAGAERHDPGRGRARE